MMMGLELKKMHLYLQKRQLQNLSHAGRGLVGMDNAEMERSSG
jgi:hypothetical protein